MCKITKITICQIFKGFIGLRYLPPLSTIFQLYCGGQFYWWRKPQTVQIYNLVVDWMCFICLYLGKETVFLLFIYVE
jgi:hypothetical protein